MTDLHLWRPTHGEVEDMRGIVPEEKLRHRLDASAFLTLAVVSVVWTFGF